VTWNGKVYPTLPLGKHGKGRTNRRVEIFTGHVRQMIEQLGIDRDCATGIIPNLY
jgi:hypothetical protein